MITEKKLSEAIKEFAKLEKRGSFYNMAINLIDNNFELEAYFLILSTWNFAVFRYALKDFDIDGFKKQIRGLAPCFNKIKNESFKSIDFNKYKADIIKIYETLSAIKGVQFTGASKIMHLKDRNIFVMWDDYIRGNKPRKWYSGLQIVKDGQWQFKKYNPKLN